MQRWTDAFNARDLHGMLACLDEKVEFYPLRVGTVRGPYRGHDGVRDWFARLERDGHEHQIAISRVRALADGGVLSSGSLTLAHEADLAPFCGLHRIREGLIVAAHHYISDPDMIEHLGLTP